MLAQNLARVRERIAQACHRGGRDPAAVTLICVTKGMPAEIISQLIALGARDIGENRVQEAREKISLIGSASSGSRPAVGGARQVRWHLIGHLQRNKAKDAVAHFAMIHSVDSAGLALKLSGEWRVASEGKSLEVFIQVNISGEATKFGCKPDDALALAKHVCQLPSLRLKGLMTIPPLAEDPEKARPYFRRLRLLRDDIQAQLNNSSLVTGHSPLLLSMGMSGDFEIAIEEGADFVRVGTAIVGTRGMGQGTSHG